MPAPMLTVEQINNRIKRFFEPGIYSSLVTIKPPYSNTNNIEIRKPIDADTTLLRGKTVSALFCSTIKCIKVPDAPRQITAQNIHHVIYSAYITTLYKLPEESILPDWKTITIILNDGKEYTWSYSPTASFGTIKSPDGYRYWYVYEYSASK